MYRKSLDLWYKGARLRRRAAVFYLYTLPANPNRASNNGSGSPPKFGRADNRSKLENLLTMALD